ncbi:HNH endonuclease [Micromonospora echinospora]
MAKADSPTKTCGEDGCGRPLRARGLCSTHYNQQHQPDRHTKVVVPCTWCGRPCTKDRGRESRYGALFCSLECRDTWRRRDKLPVPFVGAVVRPVPNQPEPSAFRRWVSGTCRHCGTPFVDRQPDARSCSALCTRRYWRKLHADEVPQAVRLHVLHRDRWRCQICKRSIPQRLRVPHPRAGTVDHVVPRSQGGSHDPANLGAAHMGCNSARNNRGGGEQLALIG